MKKAIFFDRDGTLTDDNAGYTHQVSDLRFMPGCVDSLQRLQKVGFHLFIITNQSGIARGIFSKDQMDEFNTALLNYLLANDISITKIYFCPHLPDGGCQCRKPETGMIMEAAREYDLDLHSSWMVGDKISDCQAGERSGCKSILLLEDKDIESDFLKASSLSECADMILKIDG